MLKMKGEVRRTKMGTVWNTTTQCWHYSASHEEWQQIQFGITLGNHLGPLLHPWLQAAGHVVIMKSIHCTMVNVKESGQQKMLQNCFVLYLGMLSASTQQGEIPFHSGLRKEHRLESTCTAYQESLSLCY